MAAWNARGPSIPTNFVVSKSFIALRGKGNNNYYCCLLLSTITLVNERTHNSSYKMFSNLIAKRQTHFLKAFKYALRQIFILESREWAFPTEIAAKTLFLINYTYKLSQP